MAIGWSLTRSMLFKQKYTKETRTPKVSKGYVYIYWYIFYCSIVFSRGFLNDFLQKIPFKNVHDIIMLHNFLKSISSIHPDARGHSISLTYLQRLPILVTNVLDEDEIEAYDFEIRKFQTDESIVDIHYDERIVMYDGEKKVLSRNIH